MKKYTFNDRRSIRKFCIMVVDLSDKLTDKQKKLTTLYLFEKCNKETKEEIFDIIKDRMEE